MAKSSIRIPMAFVSSLLITMALALVGISISQSSARRARLLSEEHRIDNEIERLGSAAKDIEVGAQSFVISGNAAFREPYETGIEEVETHLSELEELSSGDDERRHELEKLRRLVEHHRALFGELIEIRQKRGPAAAIRFAQAGAPFQAQQDLREELKELRRSQGSRLDAEEIRFDRDMRADELVSIGLALIAAAVAALAIFQLRRTRKRFLDQQTIMAHSSRMAALGVMAGGMAHEINTPLGIISLCTAKLQMMMQEEKLSTSSQGDRAELEDSIRTIEKTVFRVAQIVRSLRTFARDASKDPFHRTRLKDVLDDVASLCQERLHQRGIEFTRDEPAAELLVLCRPGQISQVLLNLLNNAIDALESLPKPAPGQPAPKKSILLRVRETTEEVEISVMDSGPGVAPQDRAQLMQPFFTTKALGKGTGLGLSISQGIIHAHGGKLQFDPDSPQTRFFFNLPKAQAETLPLTDSSRAA